MEVAVLHQLKVGDVTETTDPVVSSLQQEIKSIKEIFISLQEDSILKGIKTRGLIITDVCTNRGADINTLINISERDLSMYKTIIIHIGGNDLRNSCPLDSIYENYNLIQNSKLFIKTQFFHNGLVIIPPFFHNGQFCSVIRKFHIDAICLVG